MNIINLLMGKEEEFDILTGAEITTIVQDEVIKDRQSVYDGLLISAEEQGIIVDMSDLYPDEEETEEPEEDYQII